MTIHIMVATTKGLVAIQKIYPQDPEIGSFVSLRGTSTECPITTSYRHFVKKGGGLIHEDFGNSSYRVNVSGEIHRGNSWQLGFYLAHAAHAQGVLGDGEPEEGDTVICATGELNTSERNVLAVNEIPLKLSLASTNIAKWQQFCKVLFLLPAGNISDVESTYPFNIMPVSSLDEAMEVMPAYAATTADESEEPKGIAVPPKQGEVFEQEEKAPYTRLNPLVALSIVSILGLWIYKSDLLNSKPNDVQTNVPTTQSQPQPETTAPVKTTKADRFFTLFVERSDDCSADNKTLSSLGYEGADIESLLISSSVCEIFGEIHSSIKQVFLVPTDTRQLIEVSVKEGRFVLPMPKGLEQDRSYWLVGFQQPLAVQQMRQLKGTLFESSSSSAPLVEWELKTFLDQSGHSYRFTRHRLLPKAG